MRIFLIMMLLVAAIPANAHEGKGLTDRIRACLPLPVAAVDNHIKATFEVTLGKGGKVQSVKVVSHDPHSAAAAEAAQQLARAVQKCWPSDVKASPTRLTVDLSKL
ncbi:hypothetical protein EN873_27545 [bacterium M00.F.Ca.ET.230.01.1.1]|nr:hypothetical protein EN873_27545 [bacterium M00.F.Ca.ET.230.01.1.1]